VVILSNGLVAEHRLGVFIDIDSLIDVYLTLAIQMIFRFGQKEL